MKTSWFIFLSPPHFSSYEITQKVIAYLRENADSIFDPQVVDTFLGILKEEDY